jgi:hypothetical protein
MRIAVIPLAEAWATRRLVLCVRQMRALAVPARRLVEHLGREAMSVGRSLMRPTP